MLKRGILIAILISLVLVASSCSFIAGCTKEGKGCPDGTVVGREGLSCEFEECPEIQICQKSSDCNEDYECVKFPTQDTPICSLWEVHAYCLTKCENHDCEVIESDPIKVICT
ncbi:MAG: hypothetical protein ABIH25_00695 [Candidatus Woesearchaeota archaeon]